MHWIWIFVLGAVGGLACDQIHVQLGVLSYPDPMWLGQAWWVAPNFGIGTVLMIVGSRLLARRAGVPGTRSTRWLIDSLIFVAAYFSTGIFSDHPVALAVGLAVTALGRLALRRDRATAIVHAIGLGAGGAAYESALAAAGLFAYGQPQIGWVPIWLPFLYWHGASLALDLAYGMEASEPLAATEPVPRG